MVKADIPETSRDSSPEKLSVGGLTSRTSSSASSFTVDTTRESSPDYRLEISIGDPVKGSLVANNPVKTTAEKTPIPADSPLFSQQPPVTDSIKQLKNFNRSLKKAKSFRAAREKIDKVVSDRCASVPIRQEWVTFLIKKSVIGRNGWKIMTENEEMNLRLNRETIEMVTEKIRDLQFSGEVVPDKMTIYIQ